MTQRLYTRLNEHNRGKSAFAKAHRPFEIIHTESYTTASDAYQREQEIKSYKGGILFKKLINKSYESNPS